LYSRFVWSPVEKNIDIFLSSFLRKKSLGRKETDLVMTRHTAVVRFLSASQPSRSTWHTCTQYVKGLCHEIDQALVDIMEWSGPMKMPGLVYEFFEGLSATRFFADKSVSLPGFENWRAVLYLFLQICLFYVVCW